MVRKQGKKVPGSNPWWGLSAWGLHVPPLPAGYYNKNARVRLIVDSKLAMEVDKVLYESQCVTSRKMHYKHFIRINHQFSLVISNVPSNFS